jgi:hypothetical protein
MLVSAPALADTRKTIPVMVPDKGLVEMTDEEYWTYVRPMARLPAMPFEFVFGKHPHPGYHIVHDRYAMFLIRKTRSPRQPTHRGYTPTPPTEIKK